MIKDSIVLMIMMIMMIMMIVMMMTNLIIVYISNTMANHSNKLPITPKQIIFIIYEANFEM